ncbi:MAG: hypothetical protein NTW87_12095 [Planctomycetota bacterium]|nr:hypothetical protein [Planctomycetota bacterium]
MAGARIQTARDEVLGLARALPPSPEAPFIVVMFNHGADAKTFTDLPSLEEYVNGTWAWGGTSIAGGLRLAIQRIEPYKSSPLLMYLVSDGEDSDKKNIEAAENEITALLAQRHERGLENNVILKRWDGANAQLTRRLKDGGHANVVDLDTAAQFGVVSLVPSARILTADWDGNDVVVQAEASVKVSGVTTPRAKEHMLSFACRTPGVTGDANVAIKAGNTARLKLRLANLSPDTKAIAFQVAEPGGQRNRDGLITSLSTSTIVIPLCVPEPTITVSVTGTIAPLAPPRWADPLGAIAEGDYNVDLVLQASRIWPWSAPLEITVTPDLGPAQRIPFSGSGKASFKLNLRKKWTGDGAQFQPIATVARAAGLNHIGARGLPLVLRAAAQPFPPPLTTRVRAKAIGASQPTWCNLEQAVFAIMVRVQFSVEGQLAPNTSVVLDQPPNAEVGTPSKSTLRTGIQDIDIPLRVSALVSNEVARQPVKVVLRFDAVPKTVGAVRLDVTPSLDLTLMPPAPVQLVLYAPDGSALNELPWSLDNGKTLTVVPFAPGVDQQVCRGQKARLSLQGQFAEIPQSCAIELGHPCDLRVSPSGEGSFWRDREWRGVIGADTKASALLSVQRELVVRQPATIKQFLFWFVAVAGSAAVAFWFGRMFWRTLFAR